MTTHKDLLSHFSLTRLPFSKEIPVDELIRLPSVEKAFSLTQLLLESRGIGLMIGKSGTGKSSLLRYLVHTMHPGLYKPLYLCHTSCGLTEFYTHICAGLGLQPTSRRSRMFRMIQERVLSLAKSERLHVVLLIDEAHHLSTDILKEIRLLANFEFDSYNAMTVLLCGHEDLRLRFGLSLLEPLFNSITITIAVDGLPKEESFSYIEGRLSQCGACAPVFTKAALELAHQASGGIMRALNTIAHASLLNAFMKKNLQVETEHVKASIERSREM
ncbi:MAG: AAA family ATPase [Deltaproteobacteria bacterium]|nr:AAA family ATPase [Deltaproteobacteria bacterium]